MRGRRGRAGGTRANRIAPHELRTNEAEYAIPPYVLDDRSQNTGPASSCIIMAPDSPMLMAHPGARLLRVTKYGLEPPVVEQTDRYRIMREFCDDPAQSVEAAIAE